MTTYTVSSGVTSSGLVISAGNIEDVLSGGTAINTAAYGEEQLFAGGVANATTVEANGVLYGVGGTESGTVVESHGLEQIAGASTDINATVSSGGVQWAYTSTTVSGSTLSGGTQVLGGLTSSTEFGALATAGGTAIGNTVDAGGTEFVGTGATASGTVVNNGGLQQVGGSTTWTYYYATSSGYTMSTNLSGGVASGTTVTGIGANQYVSSGGTAVKTTLADYGVERVYAGGVASGTTVGADTVEVVSSGGTTTGTIVNSTGLEQLAGTVTSSTVNSGGTEYVSAGTAVDTTLSGGSQLVGGFTSGGSLAGAAASGTTVDAGGAQYVGSGAAVTGTVVNNGGTQQVGGTTTFVYYYGGGTSETINLSGGGVSDTTVNSGGLAEVLVGGVASNTTVDALGVLAVQSGGTATGTIVNSTGLEQLAGTVTSSTVNSGGTEYVSGGTAIDTTLSGGSQLVGGFTSGGSLGGAVASGTTIDAGGAQYVGSGAAVTGTVVNNGGTQQVGGTTIFDYYHGGTDIPVNLSGGGVSDTTVNSGGTVTVSSGGAATSTTVNSGGLLQVVSGGSTVSSINGTDLLVGGTINLEYATYATGATAVLNSSTDVLTVTDGANDYTLQMGGTYSSGQVFDVSSATTGLDITEALCYLHGTRILTPTGEVAIQDIRIGDLLITRFGAIQPVKWVGRQSYDARFIRNNREKIPVHIRAGALGRQLPARDLFLSPGHSVLLDDQLILASSLVNGVTVTQNLTHEIGERIAYYQVELDGHDCIIAEGAWAETFADGPGLRAQFHNQAEFFALYPDTPMPEQLNLCAPRHERGAMLDAALRPVVARAAEGLVQGRLDGYIDMINGRRIEGWAYDRAYPELPVLLEIMLDEQILGTLLACDLRPDLREAGKGNGQCAFYFNVAAELSAEEQRKVRVRRAGGGAEIAMTPACRTALGLASFPAADGLRAVA